MECLGRCRALSWMLLLQVVQFDAWNLAWEEAILGTESFAVLCSAREGQGDSNLCPFLQFPVLPFSPLACRP